MRAPCDGLLSISIPDSKGNADCRTRLGVIMYYPGQSLTGEKVAIYEPYEMLVHYIQELDTLQAKLRQRCATALRIHGDY